MKFKKGQSGNPNGRPPGSINKRTKLANLLEPHAQALINKAVTLALDGDVNALRLCIERLIPKAQPETLHLTVPDITQLETANTPLLAYNVFKSLSGDTITLEQAKLLLTLNKQLASHNQQHSNKDEELLKKEMMDLRRQLDSKYRREY